MKRFYKNVAIVQNGTEWHLLLDGKPIKTPEGTVIAAPSELMAQAMQQEWMKQGEKIDWNYLPVTRLVGGAQTLSDAEAQQLRTDLAAYVDTDMVCYWSDEEAMAAQHKKHWQPVLDFVRARFDVSLATTTSMSPLSQPAAAHTAATSYLAALCPLSLVIFGRLAPALGSLWLAIALCEKTLDVQAAIAAAQIDEAFQTARWGEDAEALAVRTAKSEEIRLLADLLLMLGAQAKVC